MFSYKDVLAEVLIDEETLQKRIQELADEVSRDYEGKELVLVCFLRGARSLTASNLWRSLLMEWESANLQVMCGSILI